MGFAARLPKFHIMIVNVSFFGLYEMFLFLMTGRTVEIAVI